MNAYETDNAAENRPILETTNAESVKLNPHERAPARPRQWILLAGILAGLTSFGAGEVLYGLIPAKKVKAPSVFGFNTVDVTPESMSAADVRNSALAFSVLGASLGGFCGIAGGIARRSPSRTLAAGLLGLTLGSAMGAGASFAVLPVFLYGPAPEPDNELILSMIMLAIVWGLTAAPAGLAFAIGLGERQLWARALAAAVLGAALGTVIFELIGTTIFPLADTVKPISTTWPSRLVARLLVAGVIGGALALLPLKRGADGPQRKSSAPATT